MGSTIAVLITKNYPSLSVDDRRKGFNHTVGFSPALFPRYEWTVMKAFCHKYKIRQKHLVHVFHRFLRHEEVYLRDFRIRTDDVKRSFLGKSRVTREMADVAIPLLFLKPFVGVDAPTSPQEVTFTRFVVTSYLFCNQPHVDMIMEFIALTKQKFKLAADSVLHFYSLTQLLILMMEDIENNAAKHVLIKCLEAQSQFPDIKIKTIVNMACKYPLLLYTLERFRRHFRRLIFGDRFWRRRKMLLPRIKGADTFNVNMRNKLKNELSVRQMTCIALIGDAVAQYVQSEAAAAQEAAREVLMGQYHGKTLAQQQMEKRMMRKRPQHQQDQKQNKERRLRFGEDDDVNHIDTTSKATIYGTDPTDRSSSKGRDTTAAAAAAPAAHEEDDLVPQVDTGTMKALKPKKTLTGAGSRPRMFVLSDAVTPLVEFITEDVAVVLKDTFGFEFARQLILYSEIPVDHEAPFIERAFAGKLPTLNKHEPLIDELKDHQEAGDDSSGSGSDGGSDDNDDSSISEYEEWGRNTNRTAAAAAGDNGGEAVDNNRLKLQLSRVASLLRKEQAGETSPEEAPNDGGVRKRFDLVMSQLTRTASMISTKFFHGSTAEDGASVEKGDASNNISSSKMKRTASGKVSKFADDSDNDSAHESADSDSEVDAVAVAERGGDAVDADVDVKGRSADAGVLFVKSREFLVGSQKSNRLNTTPFTAETEQIFDPHTNRNFRYDTDSGKVSWAKVVVSSRGRVLRETFD